MGQSRYRRRKDRLKWHTNPNCPKWPVKNFVEDEPLGPMGQMMVCPICKQLDAEQGKQRAGTEKAPD